MDCRTFRRRHLAFVDDTLPGVEHAVMERHRSDCPRCARLDACVRRSLLLVHNLPAIEPSADFAARLERRLQEARAEAHVTGAAWRAARAGDPLFQRGSGLGGFVAASSMVLAVIVVALLVSDDGPTPEPMLPPVVASAPEPSPSPIANPAVVVSASAGMPMWPALFLADELPMRVAQVGLEEGFQLVGLAR